MNAIGSVLFLTMKGPGILRGLLSLEHLYPLEGGLHCLLIDFPDWGLHLSTSLLMMIAHCQISQILIATCMDCLLSTLLHFPPTTSAIVDLFGLWVLVRSIPNRQTMVMPVSPISHRCFLNLYDF